MKIYLAGRFPMKAELKKLGEELEKSGIEITMDWWNFEQKNALERSSDESAEVGFKELMGVINADAVVAIVDDPSYAYRGTLTEIGIAMGKFASENKSIKENIFVLTGKEFTNKNCGLLAVPHIYLASIIPIIESTDLTSLAPKIVDLLNSYV